MADVDVARWLERWVEEDLTARRRVEGTAEVHDRARACAEEARAAGIPIATDLAFRERTLELEEFVEEMVVLKEARVVEQITLRRAGRDRIETLRGTLRRTAVEIEDARGRGVAVAGVAAVDVIEAGDRERIVGGVEVIAPDRPRDLSR